MISWIPNYWLIKLYAWSPFKCSKYCLDGSISIITNIYELMNEHILLVHMCADYNCEQNLNRKWLKFHGGRVINILNINRNWDIVCERKDIFAFYLRCQSSLWPDVLRYVDTRNTWVMFSCLLVSWVYFCVQKPCG